MIECLDFYSLTQEERHQRIEKYYVDLAVGDKLKIIVPYWKSKKSIIMNVKHPLFCEDSFMVYSKAWREATAWKEYELNCDFSCVVFYLNPTDDYIMNRTEEFKNFAIKHYFDVVSDMIAELTKK